MVNFCYRCDFCNKPYTNYMSLRNHMRIHGQKRYMCDLCGKAFRLARYLRNHQRIHDDGPNRFDCPSCCKSYRTMLELAQHRCTAAASSQVSPSCRPPLLYFKSFNAVATMCVICIHFERVSFSSFPERCYGNGWKIASR